MTPFTNFRSRLMPLAINNIDTDQIIPARFLKTTSKEGLDRQLFCDWRYDAQGNPKPDFILNQPRAAGAQVLLAGDNFGCGSSREHAPWALTQFGFRAVVSTSFADIFKGNSLKNSLLPIAVPPDVHVELFAAVAAQPGCHGRNRSRGPDPHHAGWQSRPLPHRRFCQALPARRSRRARLHPEAGSRHRRLRIVAPVADPYRGVRFSAQGLT